MPQKILVVDDDLFIREIYEEVINKAGYQADLAINGEEAIKKIQEGGYAIILLDMNMPDISGLEVLDGIKKNPPAIQNGPIVLLTNGSGDSNIQEALQKGAASYLIKADLTPDQLIENITKILGK